MAEDARRFAPAAERNKHVIATCLKRILPDHGLVLEIASGTGEHALHLAQTFPNLTFQPSDPDAAARASIDAWATELNLRPALALDAAAESWPVATADAILCINMIHISPWAATIGLVRHASDILPAGAPLILYGPFHRAGVQLAPSNADFDTGLRAQNPAWGLRHLEDVTALASGFRSPEIIEMPANNLIVVYRLK